MSALHVKRPPKDWWGRPSAATLAPRCTLSVRGRERQIRRVDAGAPMTTIQAVLFGIMVALAPSILLALLLWRDEIALGEDKKADLPGS